MHPALAFIIGILVAIGVILLFLAFSGVTFYGVAVPVEGSLAAALFVVALILALIFYAGVKAQFRRVKTGKEALIGAKGIATTDLKPKGEVRVVGEFWEATAKDATIPVGQMVEVVSIDGVYLVVKPVEQKA
jgi:membrane-bound serine protease (ClpP class)